jgi:WNK lysine deficient protein kinase
VYKAFDTQEGTEVAWNQVRILDLMAGQDVNKEERDRLFAEIRVLKALKHKNIMSFYDWWYDARAHQVNFITELFTSGTLRQYRKRHKHVDDEVLKRWAWQILCGLVYLHGHNPPIIHRDLKCDNIFINGSDGVVKIGDLGLATMLRSRTAPQSVLGTPEFMAPELYEEEYDDRVDVYSFGMCLLELATMQYPYAECKNAAQIYRKVSLGVRPAGLQSVACRELGEFINTCIAPRESRPRSRQLLKHPYFDSLRQTLMPSKSEVRG